MEHASAPGAVKLKKRGLPPSMNDGPEGSILAQNSMQPFCAGSPSLKGTLTVDVPAGTYRAFPFTPSRNSTFQHTPVAPTAGVSIAAAESSVL